MTLVLASSPGICYSVAMQATRLRRIPVGLALVIALSMIACRQRQPSDSAAEIFSTPPKILVTVWLSPTPQPTSAAPNLPTATPIPTLPLPTSVALQPTLPLATIPPPPALPVTPAAEESDGRGVGARESLQQRGDRGAPAQQGGAQRQQEQARDEGGKGQGH